MAKPTPEIAARVLAHLRIAQDVKIERKRVNGSQVLIVRVEVDDVVFQAKRPDVVATDRSPRWSDRADEAKRRETLKIATELLADAPQLQPVKPSDKKMTFAERQAADEELKKMGLIAERPRKKAGPKKCGRCRALLEDDGTCSACLDEAFASTSDELFSM